ncbi:MAG: terpene cyclase/mutase family protein [Firmicutes bacterium]|nr:terpene cyclase/mutase family protein [Bacillota bacterium]
MKRTGLKKVLSTILVIVLVLNMFPMIALADSDTDYVYLTASYDGKFIEDKDGNKVAHAKVPLSALEEINLEDYGLSEYLYDADDDGVYEVTALHLNIYIHETVCGLEWEGVSVEGSPGSIYFNGGLFGYETANLRYDYNGAYPVDEKMSELYGYTWGATADRIVLKDGDFIDVGSYSCWMFYGDSGTGFYHFADEDMNILHEFDAEFGSAFNTKLVRSYSDWSSNGDAAKEATADFKVYYGKTLGSADGSVITDSEGIANIDFPEEGTWYLWTDGGRGIDEWNHYACETYTYTGEMCIVSAPAYAKVLVETPVNPDQEAADAVIEKINSIGTVSLASEDVIAKARAAYEGLTDTQKGLVTNYAALTKAEQDLEGLKTKENLDREAAKAVDTLIDAIKDVTAFSNVKIKAARSAYDALTDDQKAYVKNEDALVAAEKALKEAYEEASKADFEKIYKETKEYILKLGTPTVGSIGGEWMVISLTRDGNACPEGYYENVEKFVKENINDKEQLHRSKSTENSRVILGLTSAGYDVTDVAGHNLLMGLTDMNYLKIQGINGPIWALIAFDSYDYEIPVNKNAADQTTREKLIDHILASQLDNGGWALIGRGYDPDITGMAIQALAPYYNTNEAVKEAVDEALEMLSEIQSDNGGFSGVQDGVSSESCVQVAVALTALGIDPEKDERFIKNGMSVIDAICLYAIEGGGFAHVPFGDLNGMATEQGQYALVSYLRLLNGETALYDMTDVEMRQDVEVDDDQQTGDNDQQTGDNDQQAGNNDQQAGNNDQQAGGNDQQTGGIISGNEADTKVPQTVDTNDYLLWIVAMVISVLGVGTLKRKEN